MHFDCYFWYKLVEIHTLVTNSLIKDVNQVQGELVTMEILGDELETERKTKIQGNIDEMASQLTATHRLTDETYATAEKLFGEKDLVSLIGVIGFFGMVATTANAIDATPPDAAPARLV